MQSKPENSSDTPLHLYEYAVVQLTPRVERGEVINVGLVMMCKRRRRVWARIEFPRELVALLDRDADIDAIEAQLRSFELIAQGCPGPIGTLEAHERFRWLTAVRSACITTTRPHPGLTHDLDATFEKLFEAYVKR
ncbi:MAG: DUF3037 domain-containing protein [Muribaculaceae bacterium]|nr:DUF3037 domain-containing protein [Muribaculaceae bacterium]